MKFSVVVKGANTPLMSLNGKKYLAAIRRVGDMSARAVEVDFKTTTLTWNHQPRFVRDYKPTTNTWSVSTDNKIYDILDAGAKPHVIVPKTKSRLVFHRTGFKPKSRPGYIGSNKGKAAKKDLTFALKVNHPGIKARGFALAIKTKWDLEWPRQIDRALKAMAAFK